MAFCRSCGLDPTLIAALQGPPGRDAPAPAGFGVATYTHAITPPGDFLDAGVRTRLLFDADPGLSRDTLNPPFRGHSFWDGSRIVGRALMDHLFVQINLQVSPMVEGGSLIGDVDAGSSLGPLVSDSAALGPAAQSMQRVTLKLFFQTLLNVMANGASLHLTCSVPAHVVRESVVVSPLSLYAGAA